MNMEDIYRLAIGNLATGLEDIEDRVSYLEKQQQPHQTEFDLARYRKLLEQRIANLKRYAKEETNRVEYYERCNTQIEAYEHALKLLDA
jgi:CRISPR/Cas system-associated endonuclease Cas1